MKIFFTLLVFPFIFILDRITKLMVVTTLSEGQSLRVWPGVFHLTRVNNTGAAFGMLKGSAPLLTMVSVVCIAGISAVLLRDFFMKAPSGGFIHRVRHLALALVLAGAAGNLYDRIRYGYVIDFLDFRIWPVFNIADSGICIGIFLMILSLFKTGKIP